nr:diterpene synthase 1 [Cephalotaxus harringtonia]
MAQIVCPSLGFVYASKCLGFPVSCNTKKLNALCRFGSSSQSSRSKAVHSSSKIDCANSNFENELEIFDEDLDHKSLTSSAMSNPKPYPSNMWAKDFICSLVTREQVALEDNEIDKRMEMLIGEMKDMFRCMEDGEISPSAYDTAWVARVPAIDGSHRPQFPQTLEWIVANQLADGSWGIDGSVLFACDRFLHTLSCVVSLTIWNTAKIHVQRGLDFIRRHGEEMMKEVLANQTSKVFQMVFPAMLKDAKKLGLDLDVTIFKQISEMRDAHLKRINVERPSDILYYLEGVQDIVDWKSILDLQSKDGSFLGSPASTACVLMHTGDNKCLEFLTTLFSKFGDHAPCMYPVDICERLRTVDSVEHLGIDRHFQKEIKQALDYVFRYWDERGIGLGRESLVPDINITATGLRLLRLHGYNVSSDVLKNMKTDNEEFSNMSVDEHCRGPSDMLSLYRCSQISFPKEKIMRDASAFAKDYLSKCIRSNKFPKELAINKDLRGEIEHVVDYPWHMSLPRLMARNYMEQFGSSQFWMGKTLYQMPNVSDQKYIELAKLDFNRVQALHGKEIQQITKWYADSGFMELTFPRHRPVEAYFAAAVVMFEPEYSACRIVYAKAICIAAILDDLYDAHASFDEVKLFTEAVKRWDLSLLHCLPTHMKICYLGLYNTVNELGQQGLEAQGRDVLPYLRSVWEDLLEAATKEAEWADAKYVPPLKEYLENGKVSVAFATTILNSIFFTGEPLSGHLLQHLDFRANFLHLVCLSGRLINDTRTFTHEKDRGELASCIQCYRREHPASTKEEALDYLNNLNEDCLIQLNCHFLKPGIVPTCYRKLLFNTARVAQLFYKNKDGFGMSAEEMEGHIRKSLFEPVFKEKNPML